MVSELGTNNFPWPAKESSWIWCSVLVEGCFGEWTSVAECWISTCIVDCDEDLPLLVFLWAFAVMMRPSFFLCKEGEAIVYQAGIRWWGFTPLVWHFPVSFVCSLALGFVSQLFSLERARNISISWTVWEIHHYRWLVSEGLLVPLELESGILHMSDILVMLILVFRTKAAGFLCGWESPFPTWRSDRDS